MGCAYANTQLQQPQPESKIKNSHPQIGLLTIKILEMNFLAQNTTYLQRSFNRIKFNIDNQWFISLLHHNFGLKSNISFQTSTFDFVINKFWKRKQLQVQLFSRQELRCEKTMAVSHFDLSSLILSQKSTKVTSNLADELHQTIDIKIIDNQGTDICSLFLFVQFKPEQYQILTIKVNSVTLRNYSHKKRKIYFRIEAGEETYESASADEDKTQIPTWPDAFHTFIVPASLQEGTIYVFEKTSEQTANELLGHIRLNLKMMLVDQMLQSYCQQLTSQSEVIGTIKLQTLKSPFSNDLAKLMISQPKQISLPKQTIERKQNFFTHINSMESFRKTIEKEPTTNFSSARTREFSSGRISRDEKSKSKSSSIYRKNHMLLPPIQSAAFTRSNDYKSWLEENIEKEKVTRKEARKKTKNHAKISQQTKKQSSYTKVHLQSFCQFSIIQTQSHIIEEKPQKIQQQSKQDPSQLAELPPLNNFFIQLTQDVQTIDIPASSTKKQSEEPEGKRKRKALTSSSRMQTPNTNKSRLESRQKFITIDRDLESRPLTPYTLSKHSQTFISVQSGYIDFDLSIKEESNQGQDQNTNNALQIDRTLQKQEKIPYKQGFQAKDIQKVHQIKQLGKLSQQQSFRQQKSNKSRCSPFQQQRIKNPQIQPQM